jgi:hypothetical protein
LEVVADSIPRFQLQLLRLRFRKDGGEGELLSMERLIVDGKDASPPDTLLTSFSDGKTRRHKRKRIDAEVRHGEGSGRVRRSWHRGGFWRRGVQLGARSLFNPPGRAIALRVKAFFCHVPVVVTSFTSNL